MINVVGRLSSFQVGRTVVAGLAGGAAANTQWLPAAGHLVGQSASGHLNLNLFWIPAFNPE